MDRIGGKNDGCDQEKNENGNEINLEEEEKAKTKGKIKIGKKHGVSGKKEREKENVKWRSNREGIVKKEQKILKKRKWGKKE